MPRQPRRKPKNATLPHCPGDTQTWSVMNIIATSPKFVGLNMCRPSMRMQNLLAIVMMAASMARMGSSVRSKRLSDSPEMSALRGSKWGSRHSRVQTYWVRRQVLRMAAARAQVTSKSSPGRAVEQQTAQDGNLIETRVALVSHARPLFL